MISANTVKGKYVGMGLRITIMILKKKFKIHGVE
jgi:hypothetical protein